MRSTFMGLEISKQGMYAQQSALHTTGNNISNANTPGYSRQRVTFEAGNPYPSISMNSPAIPGQMSTGVNAQTVERVRNSFLDGQYRDENNKTGYWQSRADSLKQMEDIMNEIGDNALTGTMNKFWGSLQDLAAGPGNSGARSVVVENGTAVAETFNYLSDSLKNVQGNLGKDLENGTDTVNSLVSQLNEINKQIGQVEPNGYLPNDLYDQRDQLLDELTTYANINVTYNDPKGHALPMAEGTVNIELLDANKNTLGSLLNGNTNQFNQMNVEYDNGSGLVSGMKVGSQTINADQFTSIGKVKSLMDSYGSIESAGKEQGVFPEMLQKLDQMAHSFAEKFNAVHQSGTTLKGDNGAAFFDFNPGGNLPSGAASLIKVADTIKASTDNIAASGNGDLGDGSNATRLAEVKNDPAIADYYEGVIGEMGVKAREANRLASNSTLLASSADQRRQSVSAVSLDEEMTNMIQFQHAYNASARMITLQDEILDKIINGMGVVGR
ncbi:flagellar hook-associated protein FlgK [Bacillus gobiensis]|uniref:flagellar hook-associated protein FlgK n=1 Tax=Bacillus gobiensis TaxID=1441095 RepID=UPI003D1D2A77